MNDVFDYEGPVVVDRDELFLDSCKMDEDEYELGLISLLIKKFNLNDKDNIVLKIKLEKI